RSDRRLGRNAVVLLVSFALAGYGIVAGVRSLQGSATPRPAASSQPPVPTPSTLEPAATWVHIPGELRNLPLGVAGSEGAIWIVSGRTGVVSRIDPGTNQVAGTVDAGIDATGPEVDESGYPIPPYNGTPVVGIAAFDGSVWVHGRSQLVQIDAATGSAGPTVT